ncbi:MAG: DUF2017 family protein [Acidimicrobiales bacterium]|jgi:hypothetical protein|nr:DUF2017 family protein [Acidimicrobiales bacterium]MDP6902410.1 DUF2017 family protein [Acidimicrobiales bacterium]HJL99768.1 DUF2017 family protein [Acidimicrobiales bacterium]
MFDRRFRRKRNGAVEIKITEDERSLLADLIDQLRELVLSTSPEGEVDPSLRRLYPAAYADDIQHEVEYQRLMRDQLLERRLSHLDVVETTLNDRELDQESLTSWIMSINDLRLVLGTHLDVSEDEESLLLEDDDPQQHQSAIYHYLSHLLGELVEVASN